MKTSQRSTQGVGVAESPCRDLKCSAYGCIIYPCIFISGFQIIMTTQNMFKRMFLCIMQPILLWATNSFSATTTETIWIQQCMGLTGLVLFGNCFLPRTVGLDKTTRSALSVSCRLGKWPAGKERKICHVTSGKGFLNIPLRCGLHS